MDRFAFVSLSEMDKYKLDDYHLYFILRSPSYSVEEAHFDYSKQGLYFRLTQDPQHVLRFTKLQESVKAIITDASITFSPTKEMIVFSCYLDFQKQEPISISAINLALHHPDFALMFKVLYIGQAFGKFGNRTVGMRLSGHPTLQKILIDTSTQHPGETVSLLYLRFQTRGVVSACYSVDNDEKVSLAEKLNTVTKRYDSKFFVSIAESLLVHKFQPIWNERLVYADPEYANTKSLKRMKNDGFDVISVGISPDPPLNVRLYSDCYSATLTEPLYVSHAFRDSHSQKALELFFTPKP
jgi:hypothetical protein